MNKNIYRGQTIELTPLDEQKESELIRQWSEEPEYQHLLNDIPAYQASIKDLAGRNVRDEWEKVVFSITTLADQKVIGYAVLSNHDWTIRNAWVNIAIGETAYRGKGYGTEAMNLLLKYAFHGLNLHSVSVTVVEYNERAMRSYAKVGFRYEGTLRQMVYREQQRWDVQCMGILRSEWDLLHSQPSLSIVD